MIPPELEALINILLRGVHVTNSEKQAHQWASGIINLLRIAGYEIRPLEGDGIARLAAALRSAPCPSCGWNGMPDIEPTVAACMDHGVCGCDLGRALEGK